MNCDNMWIDKMNLFFKLLTRSLGASGSNSSTKSFCLFPSLLSRIIHAQREYLLNFFIAIESNILPADTFGVTELWEAG